MTKPESPSFWVFSNKEAGAYGDSIWDMATILKTKQYSLKLNEANRAKVRPDDLVFLRIYGQGYMGQFVAGEWTTATGKGADGNVGTFAMKKITLWKRALPHGLVFSDLSKQDIRSRIVTLTHEDATKILTAQRVYERLGFGSADGEVVILEQGLEEAIKPNLKKLGLKLAGEAVQQQFSMGPGVGRSDLICVDGHGDFVVIELKRGMTSDEAIGQVLRYVGWVMENLATERQKVHGWIITGDYDEQLRLAASAAHVKVLRARIG
ncbi:MAG: hypothetical protein WCI73_09095 [Phycisphaerae bacterium]